MESIVTVAKTLRNHWKKSTVAGIAIIYGIRYGKEQYMTQEMMRAYCEEALKYGDMPLPLGQKPRHVTVVLNPAAKDGKGHKLYEKYAAPILHLAGLKVSVIKTEYEGQAKEILGVMDNTDAVLVAGGDGTLMEAVTGLLRRDDSVTASRRFPIGFIPIGKTNTISERLFNNNHFNNARLLAESAMAVIKEQLKPLNVMCVQRGPGKPVYALAKFEWGAYRDTDTTITKYWYWGPLKTKMAYIFSVARKWPQNFEAEIMTTMPCSGCSRCYNEQVENEVSEPVAKSSPRWWHAFLPKQKSPAVYRHVDYSKITNDECGTWTSESIKTPNVTIEAEMLFKDAAVKPLRIAVGAEDLTWTEFIRNGWKRHKVGDNESGNNENVRSELRKYAQKVKLVPQVGEGEEMWFSIDSENFEASPIEITLIRDRVNMYVYL